MNPFAMRRRVGRGVRRQPGEMNKVERRYADRLELLKRAGEIEDFKFESIKLRLADKTFFTADFFVVMPDMTIELHECKGAKKKPNGEPGFWAEEDAKLKIKVAAEQWPFRFVVVFPVKDGWGREEF